MQRKAKRGEPSPRYRKGCFFVKLKPLPRCRRFLGLFSLWSAPSLKALKKNTEQNVLCSYILNPAATYPPGPSPAKYFRRLRA